MTSSTGFLYLKSIYLRSPCGWGINGLSSTFFLSSIGDSSSLYNFSTLLESDSFLLVIVSTLT